MSQPESKALDAIQFKDGDQGLVTAEISTLGVVDRDRHIIALDAITNGSRVKMSAYGHDIVHGSAPPVGKGAITVEGNKAVFGGGFFLTTSRGREAFHTLKEMGADQEWSWSFRAIGEEQPNEAQRAMGARRILTKVEPLEVSPVLIGAGIGTRTVALKAMDSREASALAAQFAGITERHATPAGVPLPQRFNPAVKFARYKLNIPSPDMPTLKLVARGSLRDNAVGMFHVKRNEVWITAGLSDAETLLCVFHELAHKYEICRGWAPSERFAELTEESLFTKWTQEGREWE